MSKKIRVGVVGAGGISQAAHIPSYVKNKDVELIAVSDPDKVRVEEAADKFSIPNAYKDFSQMVKKHRLDLVSVCAPNAFHKPASIAALNAGAHVLVEKPMAMNAGECREMIAAAEKADRKLIIAFNQRYRKDIQYLRNVIEEGRLGDIYYVRTNWLRRRGIPGLGGWFTTSKLSGGGPLIDLGVHILDYCRYLMGSPKAVRVSGNVFNYYSEKLKDKTGTFDVEDMAAAIIHFENGATLVLEASWASNITKMEELASTIVGTEGGAELGNRYSDEWELKIAGEMNGEIVDIVPRINWTENVFADSVDAQFKNVINSIKNDTEPLVKAEDGLEIMLIIDAIYESARLGREVIIDR